MANAEYEVEMDAVTATVVPANRRLNVLPQYCGARYMLVVENAIYNWMGTLAPAYSGGHWDFYELSNGGFFMAIQGAEKFDIEVPTNGYNGTMSAEAACITACLFAFGQVASQTCQANIIDLYHRLREFADRHFESSEIFAAID